MPPREGETEEEYRLRREKERGEKKKGEETEEERAARKEKERAERHAKRAAEESGAAASEKKEETEEERAARKEKERAERHAKRAAEEAAANSNNNNNNNTEKKEETDEERAARKEKERAERHAKRAAEESGAVVAEKKEETEEERAARKEKERAERHAKRAAEEAAANNNNNNKNNNPEKKEETEEERAARKEKERAERHAKRAAEEAPATATPVVASEKEETADERRARKDKERAERKERERREQEEAAAAAAAAAAAVEQRNKPSKPAEETDEERRSRKDKERADKKKRELVDVNKPATPQTVRERLEARARGDKPGKVATAKAEDQPDEGGNEYDQGYEDDFEEFYDNNELAAAQRAMEKENAAARKKAAEKAAAAVVPVSAAIVEMEGVARAGFDRKSLEEQKAKAQFEKDFQRASALRRVVDLEAVRFPAVADLAPLSQYDMFVRGVGGVARNTVGENMPERASIEIQAERVVMKSKGCSVPIDLGLDPETAADAAISNNNNNNKENNANNKASGDSETAIAALARRSVDTGSLSKFLNKAGSVVLALLDEENEFNQNAANKKGSGAQQQQAQQQQSSLIPFATQSATFGGSMEFLQGRPITRVAVSPSTSQYFLAIHGPVAAANPQQQQQQQGGANKQIYPGLITIWNVHSQKQCEKVLVSFSEIRDACFSRTRPYLIYGGTVSGAVCVWDLREPAHAHGGYGVGAGSTAFRLPSFATNSMQNMNHASPVQRVVSSASTSNSGQLGGAGGSSASSAQIDTGSVEQLTSVDRTGCLFFWVLNESDESEASSSSSSTTTAAATGGSDKNNNKDQGAAALESLIVASMSTASRVRLHRMGTGNTLDMSRGVKAMAGGKTIAADNSSQNADGSSTSSTGRKESSGVIATVTDMEQSPIDATRLVISAFTGVAHVSRFGSIAAPISYGPTRLASGPGISTSAVMGAGMTAASTCVASCRADSRLLLVGYADGTIRLYLRIDTAPKLTVLSTEHQSIVSVCFAPNSKWLAFALDAAGNIFALDFAIPGSRSRAFASAKAVRGNGDVVTTMTTFVDERPETRLLVGFKSGVSEIYTFMDSALAPANKRDMYWL